MTTALAGFGMIFLGLVVLAATVMWLLPDHGGEID